MSYETALQKKCIPWKAVPMMPSQPRALGAWGEEVAAHYLKNEGYEILARNWHWGNRGEIDIICFEPTSRTACAIEVKSRIEGRGFEAREAIDQKKLARLRLLFGAWLSENPHTHFAQLSIDAVALNIMPGQEVQLWHLRNVS